MTDEIRITRRIALEKYEYYELEMMSVDLDRDIAWLEEKVANIKHYMKVPSPEISPTPSESPYDNLLEWDGPNKVRLIGYLKEKDKWIEINTYLKGLGFTWTKDGTDSRWQR